MLITAPTAEKAAELGHALVGAELAACVNVVPGLRSIYRWEGKVHDEGEVLLIVKTTREAFARLKERVLALHGYSCPEVIALPIVEGHAPYLEWIVKSVR